MAVKTVPVTPAVVAWALEEDGRPLVRLAEATALEPELLRAWAEGEAQPTVGQLATLARVLGRPRSLFLLPAPPRGAALPAAFRHPPDSTSLTHTADVLKAMRRARRVQHAAAWALRDEETVAVPAMTIETPPGAAATAVLAWLEWTDSSHPDEWTAWRARRQALEGRGLLVFSLALGAESIRGFSAWDDRAPLIVVNSTGNTPQVRSFTLMHELGHLLLRGDAACAPTEGAGPPDAEVERWCEGLAAAVLMPTPTVERVVSLTTVNGGAATLPTVRSLARACWVSHRSAALRLIELGYAGRELYSEVDRSFRPGAGRSGGSGERRHEARLRELGERPLQLVLASLQPRDALAVLRLQVQDVRSLQAELPALRAAL
jgi:Zn-dependent peptidase ImmA (M78 family)